MADFNKSYTRTAANEGDYQAKPSDPGNYNSAGQLVGTNWGISAPVYEDWIGRRPTVADMKAMSKATAKAIMKTKFWDKIRGDELPNQAVADIFFDGVVNHGRGVRLAQEVLGVATDNVFGPQTFNALVNTSPPKFYNAYKERRRQYYYELVNQNPNLQEWLPGGLWLMGALAVVAWYNRKTLLSAR
jgi:lysozyme family protein